MLSVLLAMALGCAGPRKAVKYRSAETLLEILSDFQRHWQDDTYRFQVPRDLTGRNLYKATLIRLKNYEKIHPHRFHDIVSFNRAKAYERLYAYDLAIEAYGAVVAQDSPLAQEARKGVAVCEELRILTQPIQGDGALDSYLHTVEERTHRWESLIHQHEGSVYAVLAREEQERLEWAGVRWIEQNRKAWEDGADQVIGGYQRLVSRHGHSKYIHRHLINFGDFYRELAREYVEQRNPMGVDFDLDQFEKLVNRALELYGSVASKDGILEKLEARGKQEALTAYIRSVRKLSE